MGLNGSERGSTVDSRVGAVGSDKGDYGDGVEGEGEVRVGSREEEEILAGR